MRTFNISLLAAAVLLSLLVAPVSAEVSWQKYANNPVVTGTCAQVNGPCVVWDKDENIYKIWYSCTNPDSIRYATSADGVAWSDDQLVNGIPDFGYSPWVLKIGSAYQMWFGREDSLHHATSADGINWTVSGPVYNFVGPCVLYDGSSFKGWFGHDGTIYFSTSTDGMTWGDFTAVLTAPAGWAAVDDPCVLPTITGYEMFFTLTPSSDDALYIGYATSSDGMSWSVWPVPVLSPGPSAWDSKYVLMPTVLKQATLYKMWYAGAQTNENGEGIGYATAVPCQVFADYFPGADVDTSLWTPVLKTFCFDPGPPKGSIQVTRGELLLTTYEDPQSDTWVDAAYVNGKVNLKVRQSIDLAFVMRGLLEHQVDWSGGQIRIDITDRVDMPITSGCRPAESNVEGTVNIATFGINDSLSSSHYVLSIDSATQTASLYKMGPPPQATTDIDISGLSAWYVRFYVDAAVSAGSSTSRINSFLWLDSLVAKLTPCGVIEATLDFDPNTLNLKSKGRWVTCYIELPHGYDVAGIDVSSVMLNETVQAEMLPAEIGDYDADGIPDLMVKFDRAEVEAILPPGSDIAVTVTGNVGDIQFSGTDYINVIKPPIFPPPGGKGEGGEGERSAKPAVWVDVRPNPFNPAAQIVYNISQPGKVLVQIWTVSGRLVRTLEDVERSMGEYTVQWDGKDQSGRAVSSGSYLCSVSSGSKVVTKKLMLLR